MSRETRRLFTAAVVAVAVLWLLTRIEFQERPVTLNPVPAVFGQLAGGPVYDKLATEVEQSQARVDRMVLPLTVPASVLGTRQGPRMVGALRLHDDLAVTLLPAGSYPDRWSDSPVLAHDPASGLLVVRVTGQASASPPVPWYPRQSRQPRYLTMTDVSSEGVSLRPVFVGALAPVESLLWADPIWAVPGPSELTPGSFVFTSSADLVGLVVGHDAQTGILPGSTLLAAADRLLAAGTGHAGTIGIEVQALTERLAAVTGATTGVVVTWVAPGSPAAGQVRVGDVIEAIDGRALATREHWDVRSVRLRQGETLALRVRSRGEVGEVMLVAAEAMAPAEGEAPPINRPLGLTLRRHAGTGAEVVSVERDSAADRAGLVAGDVITLVADVPAPTPAQVVRSFTSLPEAQRVMIAVTRGSAHHVMTLEP